MFFLNLTEDFNEVIKLIISVIVFYLVHHRNKVSKIIPAINKMRLKTDNCFKNNGSKNSILLRLNMELHKHIVLTLLVNLLSIHVCRIQKENNYTGYHPYACLVSLPAENDIFE